MLGLSQRGLLGVVLMIVGTVAFLPVLTPSSTLSALILVAAAALLTLGTYLVGTDVSGRAV
jgi:hypothetical protein